ncbi:MAG: PhzF family phenazine biosynthesis protein [Steroidobacteraceae bacterium]
MASYYYRLLNVFAIDGQPLSGNPLCVFENASGLDDVMLQALALQFNLSETTFIFPSNVATARVRIFTPDFEMPFAGHPTLGTAQVVRDFYGAGDTLTLEMRAGIIPVTAKQTQWTLQANAPHSRKVSATRQQLAEMLGLVSEDMGELPLWVNTGSEQLIVPLKNVAAVQACQPKLELLKQHAALGETRFLVYVWSHKAEDDIEARFFFAKGSALAEDPATGSACANLGGWFIAAQAALPLTKRILQGAAIARPSLLNLQVDAQNRIFVSGLVLELGRGVIHL